MISPLVPASVSELIEVVRSCPKLIPIGARTKPRLSAVDVPPVSLQELRGVVEYEPSEFTFTARAGTSIRELGETLALHGQYLPFEPMLVQSGATLGGTVAAGLSGPGRLRFGGLKDFILGVQFVDGLGRALRVGGKVVKNAAGFDLPKFFVGSVGRFGVLTELTFKVFPAPVSTRTLRLGSPDMESAAAIMVESGRSRWEPRALDILPGRFDVHLKLGGPAEALSGIAREILERHPGEELSDADAQQVWSDLREFKWAHPGGLLAKIVLTPAELPRLSHALQGLDQCRVHVSAGGNLVFASLPPDRSLALDTLLRNLCLSAMTLRGPGPLWLGAQPRRDITGAVKLALDPQKRFPDLDD
jgi:glycolate dehydrogenase FAD-binding subunit